MPMKDKKMMMKMGKGMGYSYMSKNANSMKMGMYPKMMGAKYSSPTLKSNQMSAMKSLMKRMKSK